MNLKKTKKLIIFDLDDTLVETYHLSFLKTSVIAKSYNENFNYDLFKKYYGKLTLEECVHIWFDKKIAPEVFRKHYNLLRHNYPYKGIGDVKKFLHSLSKKFDIGIITNSTKDATEYKLSCLGLSSIENLFKFVYHCENSIKPKPHPDQINFIIDQGRKRESICYIGDNARDFDFAKRAQIEFFGVLTGLETTEGFLKMGLKKERILTTIHEFNWS